MKDKKGKKFMGYITKESVQRRVEQHYNTAVSLGYEVFGCFAQGSMNYGDELFDKDSDVDTKCLVIPSFYDISLNKKPVSLTHEMENGEHLDIKDIRLYLQLFKKQNINIVEILFTEFYKINPKYIDIMEKLWKNRELIARYDETRALNCMVGMIYEKQKALCHPYPSLIEKIERYGFDGKQLSHSMRLLDFMKSYCLGIKYQYCLEPADGELLMMIKRNLIPATVDEAKQKMEETVEEALKVRETYLEEHPNLKVKTEVDKLLEEVAVEAMYKSVAEEFNSLMK